MFYKMHIKILTTAILFIGIVAFIFCQAHPAIGDEYGPAAGAEEPCQISTLPTAVIAGPVVAGSDQTKGHTDWLLAAFSVLNFERIFLDRLTGKAGPLVCPHGTAKQYQLTCTYRL